VRRVRGCRWHLRLGGRQHIHKDSARLVEVTRHADSWPAVASRGVLRAGVKGPPKSSRQAEPLSGTDISARRDHSVPGSSAYRISGVSTNIDGACRMACLKCSELTCS